MANYNLNWKIVDDKTLANTIAQWVNSWQFTQDQALKLTQDLQTNNKVQNTQTQQNVNTNNWVITPPNTNLDTNIAWTTVNTSNEVKTPVISEQV